MPKYEYFPIEFQKFILTYPDYTLSNYSHIRGLMGLIEYEIENFKTNGKDNSEDLLRYKKLLKKINPLYIMDALYPEVTQIEIPPLCFKPKIYYEEQEWRQKIAQTIHGVDWSELQTGGDGMAGHTLDMVKQQLWEIPIESAVRLFLNIIDHIMIAQMYPNTPEDPNNPFKDALEFKYV